MTALDLRPHSQNVLLADAPGTASYEANTRQVTNMPLEQPDYDAYNQDRVLVDLVDREGAAWANESLTSVGRLIGSAELCELAREANENPPILRTHDRFGRRIDRVEYHASYHELMRLAYSSKVHSLSWTDNRPGAQVARAAMSYLWNQGENGIGCPNVMSFAVIPLLRAYPEVGSTWEAGMLSDHYDPRHVPASQKAGLTMAMSMTEKQGGSDLRANMTAAEPTGNLHEYVLNGHKFFCSAPMGDIVLLTAQTKKGVSLFIAPRLLPDGSHNGIFLQRLKEKLGNRSNASSEIELRGTIATMIGEEGHGIREFVKYMTHYIRMDFSVASAGIMRKALTLAYHHVSHRQAFGRRISDQPQMVNALADLAIESEAALLLAMRMVSAADAQGHSEHDASMLRVGVPISKFWNCKRVNHVVLEALECHGGMGFVEEQAIARLLREAPLNSIWEGTSAMMGLDFTRALRREPGTKEALLTEIRSSQGADSRLDNYISTLEAELGSADNDLEPYARRLMAKSAMALQASLLVRNSTQEVAELFIASRMGGEGAHEFGTLPAAGKSLSRVVERSLSVQ